MELLKHLNFEILLFGSEDYYFTGLSKGAKRSLLYNEYEIKELTPLDIFLELTTESFSKYVIQLKRGKKPEIKLTTP